MPAHLSDEALMLQYRDGDLRAFQELYRRHRVGLYRFIAWRSPRAEWVDEILQDSWANLHHARGRYRPDATFRTYLYQIARNRLLDLVRQQQPLLAAEMGTGTDGRDVFDENRLDLAGDAQGTGQRAAVGGDDGGFAGGVDFTA